MGMLCHLLGIFTWIGGPLLIWLLKKDEMPFVDREGKEALNYQITVFVVFAVLGTVLWLPMAIVPFLGLLFLPVYGLLALANLILIVLASIKASKGIPFRYPLPIRLIQ